MNRNLPVIVLNETAVFPGRTVSIEAQDPAVVKTLEQALWKQEDLFVAYRQGPMISDILVHARIGSIMKDPAGSTRVVLEGFHRYRADEPVSGTGKRVSAEIIYENTFFSADLQEAMIRTVLMTLESAEFLKKTYEENLPLLQEKKKVDAFTDLCAQILPLNKEQEVSFVLEPDPIQRGRMLIQFINHEEELMELQEQIHESVMDTMNKGQRDAFLREQIRAMQQVMGDTADSEFEKYEEMAADIRIPEEVRNKLQRELRKIREVHPSSPEYTVGYEYLEQVYSVPWIPSEDPTVDLEMLRDKLDRDHYGMEEVKDRVLEFIAAADQMPEKRCPILLLVGPPGVGKSSIAHSIAEGMERKYIRISLGGVRDEAEIRGHRKTYIAAMPGRIMTAMKKAGTSNPLILLDELDKMASDLKGDPSAALLEVLDPELNRSFRDTYLELPYDLSHVFFLATANDLSTIPRPLLDRMEIIELESYTPLEKIHIAKEHLLGRAYCKYGLKPNAIKVSDEILSQLIREYTRESGVRNLERMIESLIRKAMLRMKEKGRRTMTISSKIMHELLEAPYFDAETKDVTPQSGLVNGLAWTSVGGEVLEIEAIVSEGKGDLILTGKMGEVMKESASLCYSYMHSIREELEIPESFFKEKTLHLHIPEGAVPKDGPSAGISMCLCMISAATGRKVRQDYAMTGELTLRGKVLPIGGLKEKMLAAKLMGIDHILLSEKNRKDAEKLSSEITEGMTIQYVTDMHQVIDAALI